MTIKSALAVFLANALASAALLAGYAFWIAPSRAPRLAVLDIAEIYRLKEREVAALLVKRDSKEEERSSALQEASAFGDQVMALIERLPAECECLIVARGAIVGPVQSLPDLTPAVRRRLGL
jgi:hypothetical protein